MSWYILNKDHTITQVDTNQYLEWSKEHRLGTLKNPGSKVVGSYQSPKNDYRISTVFLGLDHSFSEDEEPLLFETLVFDGELEGEMERYSTWDEAVEGHAKMIKRCGGMSEEDEKIKNRFDILDL
jgi:hypothetical protein